MLMRLADDPESGDFKNLDEQTYSNYKKNIKDKDKKKQKQKQLEKCTQKKQGKKNAKCRNHVHRRNAC